MNVSNFFKELRTRWQRENRHRSEDYLLGGNVALREAAGAMMSVADVVEAERANKNRIATQRENSEVQQRNKELNASLRALTTKYEKLQADLAARQLEAMHPQIQAIIKENRIEAGLKKRLAEITSECGSLRFRNAQLLELASQGGQRLIDPGSQAARDKGYIAKLEKELDIHRAGPHTVTVSRIIKRIRRVLKRHADEGPASQLILIARQMDNYDNIIAGREPDEWSDNPEEANHANSINA